MIQSAQHVYQFHLGRAKYLRIRFLAWLFLGGLLACAMLAVVVGILLWMTYVHSFTLYLKWQDALVALVWFIAFTACGGIALIVRFLYALRAGYTQGMLTLVGDTSLTVRDLSSENLKSIFWIMNSAFWCFLVLLVGLVPAMLIGWTLRLTNPLLMVLTTGIAGVLGLVGLIGSVIAASFIIVGCIGGISLGRKLGSSHSYQLNGQAVIRIDSFVLTIMYPGRPESMIDLNLLTPSDQRQLLSLLHKRWMDAEQVWNPSLGEEIIMALTSNGLQAALV